MGEQMRILPRPEFASRASVRKQGANARTGGRTSARMTKSSQPRGRTFARSVLGIVKRTSRAPAESSQCARELSARSLSVRPRSERSQEPGARFPNLRKPSRLGRCCERSRSKPWRFPDVRFPGFRSLDIRFPGFRSLNIRSPGFRSPRFRFPRVRPVFRAFAVRNLRAQETFAQKFPPGFDPAAFRSQVRHSPR